MDSSIIFHIFFRRHLLFERITLNFITIMKNEMNFISNYQRDFDAVVKA